MKLYIDDIREAPNGWTLARTITQAIRILSNMDVKVVSIDHDICYVNTEFGNIPEETFEAVVRFISLMPVKPIIIVHSSNPTAKEVYEFILGQKIFDKSQYQY